ncbi:coronin-6 [Lasiosphaeria miniovina]|uniref:Coronin n=1 Tax=Lasiosphaeria miniovina TaxID=1954250 RepID=A0AA40AW48_9PEZI|nr:coronin-6 [Lasiosphaeria miniovina]KAK0723071.1 coronin-6 [Lasiosphaeria miniovina]
MAGRFVRASKYRHVFGKSTRKEFCYDNLHISRNAWDTNLIKANPEYLAVNWESSGGGAFAVIPLNERGKLPDQIPLFRGHTAAVLDTDWNPFNDRIIASASDDAKVFIWQVPQGFSLYSDAEEVPHVSPVAKLTGHSRKVGHVLFNPAAENILASASGDLAIKLWDISTGQAHITLKHPDIVQSLSWSANGSMLVTTSRDKKLRVWDVRQQTPVHEHPGHEGAKNSRAVWMGEHNRIATTGFTRTSERQIGLWEPGRKDPIGGLTSLDSISGVCMPFWDDGSNCLYLAGKGDGNIRYFEYENDKFEFLSEYKSGDPQRGIAFLPRRGVNVHENEVMRAFKTVSDSYIEPISFTVPRRAETFQSDIFPPAVGSKPGVSAKEWFDGKTALPPKIDLESIYDGNAPVELPADFKPSTPAIGSVPAPALAPAPAARKAPEPAPIAPRSPPVVADQKASMSAVANKFQDEDESDDDDAETSSFEEVTRPAPRAAAPIRSKPTSPVVTAPATQPKPSSPLKSPQPIAPAVSRVTPPAISTPPSTSVEESLAQIKTLLEQQVKIIGVQSEKINAQSEIIKQLTTEVETLKKKVGPISQDQSERIRQLELDLESARS